MTRICGHGRWPAPPGQQPPEAPQREPVPAQRVSVLVQPQQVPLQSAFDHAWPEPGQQDYGAAGETMPAPRQRSNNALRWGVFALLGLTLGMAAYAVPRFANAGTGAVEIEAVGDPDALVRVDGIVRGNPPLVVEGLIPGVHQIVEYETRLNHILPKYDDVVVCTYDLNKFSASTVMDILRTHPQVIVGGVLQQNPFFVPPDQFLAELRARKPPAA